MKCGRSTCDDCFPPFAVAGAVITAPQIKVDEIATTPVSDAVHRPNHYTRFKIEPILFIRENELPFWAGNVIKYTLRYDAKDGLQDLKKARRYLDMEIARLEGRPDWNG